MELQLQSHPCTHTVDYTKIGAVVTDMSIFNSKADKEHQEVLRDGLFLHYVSTLIRGGIHRLKTHANIRETSNSGDSSSKMV